MRGAGCDRDVGCDRGIGCEARDGIPALPEGTPVRPPDEDEGIAAGCTATRWLTTPRC
jgi:hypothetical protein